MAPKLLEIGAKTPTGHVVEEILGQGPNGAVYLSTNKEIRWVYWADGGLPSAALALTISRFDAILSEIKVINNPTERRSLYELAGKSLYIAFHSDKFANLAKIFSETERRLKIAKENERAESEHKNKKTNYEKKSVDIVVVCALHDPELQAMLNLSASNENFYLPNDPQTYHSTEWLTVEKEPLNVVMAAPNQMGLTASGILAAKMVLHFRPKVVVMGGIAAGTKYGKQGFGDIVAPEHTFDYGAAKSIQIGKRQDIISSPQPLSIQAKLLGRLKEWQRSRKFLDQITANWQSSRPSTQLQVHTGPIFSGPTVQQTNKNIDKILGEWRKLSGVEMEAYAVHRACNDTIDPPPMYLCAKSICDFAIGKNDDWQHYAAYTSSRFINLFLSHEWKSLIPER